MCSTAENDQVQVVILRTPVCELSLNDCNCRCFDSFLFTLQASLKLLQITAIEEWGPMSIFKCSTS